MKIYLKRSVLFFLLFFTISLMLPYEIQVPDCKQASITVPFHSQTYIIESGMQQSFWFGLFATIQLTESCEIVEFKKYE